jgi:hypothetical protein
MRSIVRTIYGNALQTARHIGIQVQIPQFSTLDTAMQNTDIIHFLPTLSGAPATTGLQSAPPYNPATDSDHVDVQYLCIGNGGHYNVAGVTGGVPYTEAIPHKSSDSGLYSQIPFVVVPVTADLGPADRAKYRMRVIMIIGGVVYAAYYARVLDVSVVNPVQTLTTVSNNVSTPTPFVPTINNLKPAPPAIGATDDGSYLAVTATVTIPFTAQELLWLTSACALVFGNPNYAIISEVALCSGVEKVVTQAYPNDPTAPQTPVPVTSGTYIEAVGVQVACFISSYYPVQYTNEGFNFTLDLGTTEPLFGTSI